MPSYKERAELIKALSEDQYFKARLNKDESESVRIGDRDGRTGRYQVLRQDGGITSNGIKTFNQSAPQDGFVRVLGNSSGGIALDHRNRKREERRKVLAEDRTQTIAKILFSVTSNNVTTLYIGGDRDTPVSIYTVPDGYEIEKARISATGILEDDWIVQFSYRKKNLSYSWKNLLVNPSSFDDSFVLVTLDPIRKKEIKTNGFKKISENIPFSFCVQRVLFAYDDFIRGYFCIRDTYTISTITWGITQTKRTCDIYAASTDVDIQPSFENIRNAILLNSKPILLWESFLDVTLPHIYPPYKLSFSYTDPDSIGIPVIIKDNPWLIDSPTPTGFGWWSNFESIVIECCLEIASQRDPEPYTWKPLYTGVTPPELLAYNFSGSINQSNDPFGSYFFLPSIKTTQKNWYGFFCNFYGFDENPIYYNVYHSSISDPPDPSPSPISIPLNGSNTFSVLFPQPSVNTYLINISDLNIEFGTIPPSSLLPFIGTIPNIRSGSQAPNSKLPSVFVQGLDSNTQIVKIADDYFYYKNGNSIIAAIPPLTDIPPLTELQIASSNLIDDMASLLTTINDDKGLVAAFLLQEDPQPSLSVKELDIAQILTDGNILSTSVYLTIDSFTVLPDYAP